MLLPKKSVIGVGSSFWSRLLKNRSTGGCQLLILTPFFRSIARSLFLFLRYAGFKKIHIFKIQRHNLNNHLGWILKNKPGGHEYFKNLIKDRKILISYNEFLIKNNLNDTLIAVAR